jgi:hypothetical protein
MSKNHALSVLSGLKIAPGANLNSTGKALNEQLRLIRNADTEFAMRAVYVGTALLMVKESLAHGEFGPWLDKHIDDLGRRQVNYYMRLSLAVLDSSNIEQKALAALPVGDIEGALTVSKGPTAAFRSAVEKFVGDSSLADLLAEHCGKTKAANKKKGAGAKANADDDTAAAQQEVSVQDRFNELDHALQLVRKSTADKALWMNLSKDQHRDLKAAADATAEHVTALYVKTHGRK